MSSNKYYYGTGYKSHWKKNNLYKAVVIPKLKNKSLVVVQHAKSYGAPFKNLTFPGGGCSKSKNKSCATKELREETRNSIRAQKFKHLNTVKSSYRTNKELKNNKSPNKRTYARTVTTHYDIYGIDVNNKISNIKKRYKNFKLPTNPKNKKAYTETNNINSRTIKNLRKPNSRMWWLMRNLVLNSKSKKIQSYCL
jgi:hypothetical protein